MTNIYPYVNMKKPSKETKPMVVEEVVEEEESSQIQFSLPYNLIMLNGEISDKTGRDVSEQLLAYDYKNALTGVVQPIHLMINSGGGSVTAAWQICDIMDCIATPVFTIGVGTVASAALAIFINGTPGHRILSEKASVLSHQYTWGIEGKYKDLALTQKEFENIYERLRQHYVKNTKHTSEFVKKELLSDDCWLTALEAKKMKLADHVIDFRRYSPFFIAAPPDNGKNKNKNNRNKTCQKTK